MVKVAVIDTMPELSHKCFQNAKISINENYIQKEYLDKGHGTAVCNILNSNMRNAEIIVFPIFRGTNDNVDIDELLECLNIILLDDSYDIVNLSCGVIGTDKIVELENICKKLYDKKIIVISAFNNNNIMTYPACFDSVIGVDTTSEVANRKEYIFVENSPINIRGYDRFMRVAWENNTYIYARGSSFITPYISSIIGNYIEGQKKNHTDIMEALKHNAKRCLTLKHHISENNPFNIKRAIIFPFNKEMHALIRFNKNINFEIVGCYDVRRSMKIGKRLEDFFEDLDERIGKIEIKDIEKIDDDLEYDTIIIGHLDQLKKIESETYIQKILRNEAQKSVNIYAYNDIFEEFSLQRQDKKESVIETYYFPKIAKENYPKENLGKMWQIDTPIVTIVGTKSKQGKYTLLLKMLNWFKENNYIAEFISTEPNGWLLGAADVYAYGYHAEISIDAKEGISILNDKLHKIDHKGADIIFSAAQSNIMTYSNMFLPSISMFSESFLIGMNPDVVILCVSIEDDLDYIDRTIKYVESIGDCKIIGIDIFPFKTQLLTNELSGLINEVEVIKMKKCLEKLYPEFCVTSSNLWGCDLFSEKIITYLSEE